MLSTNIIKRAYEHFEYYHSRFPTIDNDGFVVSPSLPILYFGDLEEYTKSKVKIVTVGKNPSNNEFTLNSGKEYSFCRFPSYNKNKKNLTEVLNTYFKERPLTKWFSCYEPILNGMQASFFPEEDMPNRAIHTDICTPLATDPTWSKLLKEYSDKKVIKELEKEGFELWKDLIEELQPDIILISVPKKLLKKLPTSDLSVLCEFKDKKDGNPRKTPYIVNRMTYTLKSGKQVLLVSGQAANKPFDTISNECKMKIGNMLSN